MTMTSANPHESTGNSTLPGVFLSVRGQEEASRRIPVLVRSLSAGVIILETKDPWSQLDPPALDGAEVSLRRAVAGKPFEIPGSVIWVRSPEEDPGRLSLGMRLAKPDQMTKSVLENLLPCTSTDLATLWEHWDQAKISQATAFTTGKVHSALLGLTLGVIIFKLVEPKSFNIFGDLSLLICGLVGAVIAINFLKQKKALL